MATCDGPIKKVYEQGIEYQICLNEPTQSYIWNSQYTKFEVDLCRVCYSNLIRKGKDIVAKQDA